MTAPHQCIGNFRVFPPSFIRSALKSKMNLLKTFTSHPWREGKVLALSPQKQQECSCKWHFLSSCPQKWWHSFLHIHRTPQRLRAAGFWLPHPSPSHRDAPGDRRLLGQQFQGRPPLFGWEQGLDGRPWGHSPRTVSVSDFTKSVSRWLDHQGVSTEPHTTPGQRNCKAHCSQLSQLPQTCPRSICLGL